MKNSFLLTSILFSTFIISNINCSKSDPLPDGCIKVKMLGYLCGQANFQILDEKYYDKGENGWSDANGNKLDHVFHGLVSCVDVESLDLMARPSYEGLEFTVKIIKDPSPGTCFTCKALLYGPKTWHYVKIAGDECK